jgi:23S rRNA (adenine2503-C2)-methyltransferase
VRRPARTRTLAFQRELEARGIACTVRVEKGSEISAACGQLRAEPVPLTFVDAPVG